MEVIHSATSTGVASEYPQAGQGKISRNVASMAKAPRPKQDPAVVHALPIEDTIRLLEAAKGDRLEALWLLTILTGLRRGEALGLRWDDLDFDFRTMAVRQQMQRRRGKLVATDLKTDSSRRTLPLSSGVVAALQAHRGRQLEELLLAGDQWVYSGLVFTSITST